MGNQKNKMLKLANKSLSHLKDNFPVPDFSLIFREAVAAAHGLQPYFLWINALCMEPIPAISGAVSILENPSLSIPALFVLARKITVVGSISLPIRIFDI